ncbi:MAG: hypothetical protein R3C26_01530 [Calditrichia bacterium]
MESKFAAIIDALASNGWIIIPDFLPKNYLKNLAEEATSAWESGDFWRAGVGQGDQLKVRTEIRSDFIHWLEPENLTALQREYWQLFDDLRLKSTDICIWDCGVLRGISRCIRRLLQKAHRSIPDHPAPDDILFAVFE